MATQETLNQVQQLYVAYYGRPADAAGLAFWADELEANGGDVSVIINDFGNSAEFEARFGDLSNEELVNNLYQQLFGRDADAEGLAFYTGHLESGDLTLAQIASEIAGGAQDNEDGDNDLTTLNNKVAAANLYTAATEGQHDGTDADNYAAAWLAGIDADTDVDAIDMDEVVANLPEPSEPSEPVEPGEGETIRLTQRADDLQGADGSDTTFEAPVTQNETGSGQLANTFETGDVLDGGADSTNVLRADLIATGAIGVGGFQSPAISAETTNIQEVYFRAQNVQGLDLGSNTTAFATIDAEKMVGVEQWWTDNSRADVRIEDVRSRPTDTILGMRNTDPEVGFEVYFNPLFMDGGQSSQSQLVIQIAELDGGVVNTAAELANISVNALSFELDGDAITISSDAMAEANTWEELEAAIVAALAEEGLGDLQVTRGDEGQFLLFDAEGREFSNQGGFTASATTDQQIDIRNRITQDLQTEDEQTETTLVLDGAGNGSRGGDVNIAAMSGDRGVEVFNVQVDNDSHIRTLRSENNPNDTGSYAQEQQLEEVYLTHVEGGAQGAFQLGSRTVEQSGVSTTTDDRLVTDGLLDVRVFDAAGYAADIKLGASLTEAVFDKYLAGAEEPVQFSYLLGDGNNNLSLFVDNDVASDPDFALEIVGGAGDDRINLTGLQYKNSTSIDGAEGSNIVEVNTTTGAAAGGNTAAENSWASFENIQTLVVAGDNNTTQNLVVGNMGSLEQVVIATGNVDTNVQQMRMDQDLTISGKNQTLGAGQSNEDQSFGTVAITNTSAVSGVGSFEVLLENTARVDGELSVNDLVVDGADSAIRTLDVVSAGRRETANFVNAFNGEAVTTLNLSGSQDLSFNVASMATSPATGGTPPLTVTGAELGGDLTLGMNADLLVRGAEDSLEGTAGEEDSVIFTGTFEVDGDGEALASTNVSGFETVQMGTTGDTIAGLFNAANVTGVDLYEFVNVDTDVAVEGLRAVENVLIQGAVGANDIALSAANRSTDSVLNATISQDAATFTGDLSVTDYRTIDLTLENATTSQTQVDFAPTLELLGNEAAAADVLTDDPAPAANYARTLNITGGRDEQNTYTAGVSDDAADTLNLGDNIPTSLSSIDVSGFKGEVTGGFTAVANSSGDVFTDADVQQALSNNTTIRVGEYEFSWDNRAESDGTATVLASIDTVSTFRFTEDAYADGVVWQINGFLQGSGDAQNLDKLDLRDLGVESEADLSIVYGTWDDTTSAFTEVGAYDETTTDAVSITSNQDQNFEILLTGLDGNLTNGLVGDNFIFA